METFKILGIVGLGLAAVATGLYVYNKKTNGKLVKEVIDKLDDIKNLNFPAKPEKKEN